MGVMAYRETGIALWKDWGTVIQQMNTANQFKVLYYSKVYITELCGLMTEK